MKVKRPRITGKKMVILFFSVCVHMAFITLETQHTVITQWYTTMHAPDTVIEKLKDM
jgi:hypothetical protein